MNKEKDKYLYIVTIQSLKQQMYWWPKNFYFMRCKSQVTPTDSRSAVWLVGLVFHTSPLVGLTLDQVGLIQHVESLSAEERDVIGYLVA